MPSVYSKSLPYTCYEIGHTWQPSCCVASTQALFSAFTYSCQMYALIYLVTAALRYKKFDRSYFRKIVSDFFRSSIFLAMNGFGYVSFFCLLRHLLGHINYLTVSFLPGFLSALLAIQIERPSRRSLLAIYVSNVASECAYNACVGFGYMKPVAHGSVLLAVAALSVLGACYCSPHHQPSTQLAHVFSYFVGNEECGASEHFGRVSVDTARNGSPCPHSGHCYRYCLQAALKGARTGLFVSTGLSAYSMLSTLLRHRASFLPSSPIFTLFTVSSGASLSSLVHLLCSLVRRFPCILKRLFYSSHARMAICFAWLAGVFRLVRCGLRRSQERSSPAHGALAGAAAGAAFLLYPMPSLTLYTAWKALETLAELSVKTRMLPAVPGATELLYAIMTGYLFHVSACYQQFMKSSYWRMLMGLTDQKMSQFNRHLLHTYGLDSAANFRTFWPKYQREYLSDAFVEAFPLGIQSLPSTT